MEKKTLQYLGFKPEVLNEDEYWFELNYKEHKFITNDSPYFKGEDKWFIGYQNTETNEEFWFNQRLFSSHLFKKIFHMLTNVKFEEAKFNKFK